MVFFKTVLHLGFILLKHLRQLFTKLLAGFLIILYSFSTLAQAEEKNECLSQATTEFENVLCKITIKSPATPLPNLNEFRKNNSKMQYLLLKRSAKRLGITLKKPKSVAKKSFTKSSADLAAEEGLETIKMSAEKSRSLSKSEAILAKPSIVNNETKLKECQILENSLKCPFADYALISNKSLQAIDSKLLSSENQLLIERPATSQADIRYKTRVYRIYIEKMLSIGLGYSTMSFTKFSYIYDDSVKQGEDFSERVFDMFELLKKERKTNSIKARYDNETPQIISWCMNLSDTLIVCDNKNQNWVYKRAD